jgi:hypothetical protein
MKPTFSRSIRISIGICAASLLFGSLVLIKQYNTVQGQESRALNESVFKTLQFRSISPAIMGGRIDDFAVIESNPHIIYVATASGGIWKTVNRGAAQKVHCAVEWGLGAGG